MYKYTFPKKIVAHIKKKRRKIIYWTGEYKFTTDYFKPLNLYRVWVEFERNINFTYYSKSKLEHVPFAGYLIPVKYFEENSS